MKILAISDTHGLHNDFKDEDFIGIDMVIHAGDISNSKYPVQSEEECHDFLQWYSRIPVNHRVLIAGNHDTAIAKKMIKPNNYAGINYLEHESITIGGINIFGSPYTPTYGDWSFMKPRGKLAKFWGQIPLNTDILVTHGPPKGILDLSRSCDNVLEYCGDKELYNEVYRVMPKHHIFGHIHNFGDCYNKGSRTMSDIRTKFHNVSCVTDRKFALGLTSKGIIINYNEESK